MRDIEAIRGSIEFDPAHSLNILDLQTSEYYTRRLEEYRVWFSGNTQNIRDMYYRGTSGARGINDQLNYFWATVPRNKRMLHSGIPGLISRKMSTVLFGSGYKIALKVYDGKDVNEKLTDATQELVTNLIDLIKLNARIKKAAQIESYSGGCFYKFSHKVALSDYPILEITDNRRAELVEERDIVTAIIFKSWIYRKTEKYRLDEIYTTNEDGDALITYKLYKLNVSGEAEEVGLDSIPETVDIIESFNCEEGFVYTGLKGILAFYKPNKLPSHEFPDSPYGASDYEGALDSFDALDEAYSQLISEIRDNQTIRYIPQNLIPIEEGEYLLDDSYVTNYVKINGDDDQDADNKIEIQLISDKTESILGKYKAALTMAINQAGLSPLALGITGLEAINSSDKSQQERNKVTLETRKEKLSLWKPFLENLILKALELNSWMLKNTSARQDAFEPVDVNFDNLSVNIEFGPYIIEPESDKITNWGNAKMQKVASTREAVKNIHPDWDDELIDNEVAAIKFEEGVTQDNPIDMTEIENMMNKDEDKNKAKDQDKNPDTKEEEKEDGKDE